MGVKLCDFIFILDSYGPHSHQTLRMWRNENCVQKFGREKTTHSFNIKTLLRFGSARMCAWATEIKLRFCGNFFFHSSYHFITIHCMIFKRNGVVHELLAQHCLWTAEQLSCYSFFLFKRLNWIFFLWWRTRVDPSCRAGQALHTPSSVVFFGWPT